MINIWWLIPIAFICYNAGIATMAILAMAGETSRELEKEEIKHIHTIV